MVADQVVAPTLTAADLSERLGQWTSARVSLLNYFLPSRADELAREFGDDLAVASDLTEELAETAVRDIEEWAEHIRVRAWLSDMGFTETMAQLETRLTRPRTSRGYRARRCWLAWTDATVKADGALKRYRAADRDALVAGFQDLDRRLVADAHGAVVNACSARRPRTATAERRR